jgi:GTPase Era involved in 16S rRNA processing
MSTGTQASGRGCVRIAVVGEFNSGKTTLVNALLGAPVLPTGFTLHTAFQTVISYAPRPRLAAELAQRKRIAIAWEHLTKDAPAGIRRLHVGMPLARLEALKVIDTPGLGYAVDGADHEVLAACRRADVVIWCTPAVQAWKASEERAWLTLPERVRRRGILAVTFLDAVGSASDARRVMARLDAEAGALFRSVVAASAHDDMPVDAALDLPTLASACSLTA